MESFFILPSNLINIRKYKFWSLFPLDQTLTCYCPKKKVMHNRKKGKIKLDSPYQKRRAKILIWKISEGIKKISISLKIMYILYETPNKMPRDIILNIRASSKIYLEAYTDKTRTNHDCNFSFMLLCKNKNKTQDCFHWNSIHLIGYYWVLQSVQGSMAQLISSHVIFARVAQLKLIASFIYLEYYLAYLQYLGVPFSLSLSLFFFFFL